MSVAELRELDEVRGLIARGQQVGVLTYAEIAAATAELGLDDTDVEELHDLLERCEIELVEEIGSAIAASVNIERAPGKRTRRRAALNLKPEGTTDALQLFLRDIAKVRLLTVEEEVDLAKRIERGVESITRSARAPISLEKPVGDEEESEFGQFIADERAESPYERAVEILREDAVRDALENLSYRERRVLELRYGLVGEQARTHLPPPAPTRTHPLHPNPDHRHDRPTPRTTHRTRAEPTDRPDQQHPTQTRRRPPENHLTAPPS